MKEWRKVFGTEAEKPEEFDTTQSPSTVYQRRNVKKATKTETDGNKVTGWERDERELTVAEYEQMKLMSEIVSDNTSGIITSVTEFQKEAVIDEYTKMLMEEGAI